MRVGIDVRPALLRKTGVGRYLLGLVPALATHGVEVTAFSSSLKDRLDPARFPGARGVDRRIPVRVLDALWHYLRRPSFSTLAGPVDVVHSPSPIPLPEANARQVVTLHDLFFLRSPAAAGGDAARRWVDALPGHLHAIDAFVCVSHATAGEAHRLLGIRPEMLHVVHHGLEPGWHQPLDDAELATTMKALGVAPPFLLCVGTIEARKNLRRVISAFDHVRRAGDPELTLVLAGPDGNDRSGVDGAIARLELGSAVRLLGYLEDHQLKALYQSAQALLMPSIDEGFGFPVLEALACGCPVVASATGALPEIGGDACEYVDPFDEESLLEGIERVLGDDKLVAGRRQLGRKVARSFTWERAAKQTAAVYARITER